MTNKRALIFLAFASASALLGQTGSGACIGSTVGYSGAAAEINNKACATETFTAGTGGVTANTLVITDTSNPAKVVASTGTGAYGIAASTVSATASVQVERYGQWSCITDNNAVAGDLVIVGTGNVTYCRDSGQTSSFLIPIGTRIIGTFLTSATAPATATVSLTPAHFGTLTRGVIGVAFGNPANSSALTSGSTATAYLTVPQACNINSWNITVDAGTITFGVWRLATGTAIPTSSNSIVASAPPALATGTALHSTAVSTWAGYSSAVGGVPIAANDVVGINISAVSTAKYASLVLGCQ
jgi:hypothetical protein